MLWQFLDVVYIHCTGARCMPRSAPCTASSGRASAPPPKAGTKPGAAVCPTSWPRSPPSASTHSSGGMGFCSGPLASTCLKIYLCLRLILATVFSTYCWVTRPFPRYFRPFASPILYVVQKSYFFFLSVNLGSGLMNLNY